VFSRAEPAWERREALDCGSLLPLFHPQPCCDGRRTQQAAPSTKRQQAAAVQSAGALQHARWLNKYTPKETAHEMDEG